MYWRFDEAFQGSADARFRGGVGVAGGCTGEAAGADAGGAEERFATSRHVPHLDRRGAAEQAARVDRLPYGGEEPAEQWARAFWRRLREVRPEEAAVVDQELHGRRREGRQRETAGLGEAARRGAEEA